MLNNGQYVGLGLGDSSAEIAKIKAWLKPRFTPARNTLDDGPVFTPELATEIARIQKIRVAEGELTAGTFLPGVINLATKYAMHYLSKEKILPICFSVEGHMSDMWVGPAAWIGSVLAAEGRALHFPTWYDRFALPFNNKDGVHNLAERVGSKEFILDNGAKIKFPEGTPWVATAFSQGSMIWCDFYRQYLLPGKPLNWRLKDLRGAIVCGNPDREKGVVANWIPDPPAKDRQGIMDDSNRMVNTPWWWLEIARKGDLYTDNQSGDDEIGLYKTSVAMIVTQNRWAGGPAGMLARVIDILTPVDDLIPITMAIIQAVMFVGNMGVHGEYPLDPAVQFLRERLAAAA